MKARLIKESLNERWFNRDGSIITFIINFLMASVGTAASTFLYKNTGDVAWGIMAPVMFGVGSLGLLGGAADLDYFEWINDLEDWIKSRKYRSSSGRNEIDEKINKVKDAVLNNPNITPGKKAHITRLQKQIAENIEDKDWKRVRWSLQELQSYMKKQGSDITEALNEYFKED